ncbi:MAG: Ldh family oxidoreductase [Rhodospirillales bacterium]|nr:Ldh family oxidoreductase [Rhodospirillales bacterium]
MSTRPTRTVEIPVLRDLMERLLRASGCPADSAAIAADAFLEADIRGIPQQGLDHMYTMLEDLKLGRIDPKGRPRIAMERDSSALIDGGRGPGQVAGVLACDVAVEKATRSGAAAVGVSGAGDIFMIGFYAERIARRGLVGLVFSDSPPKVHAFGGTGRVMGTNPFAIAVPTADGQPFLLDMATSAWSASLVRHAMYHGEQIPDGIGVLPDGLPTRDPVVVATQGAIGNFGGHKGFGIGLMVGIFSGILTGCTTGPGLKGWLSHEPGEAGRKGHFFIAVNLAAFGDAATFQKAASRYLREIKASKPVPRTSAIRIPGERPFAERERSVREGRVQVYEAVWQRTAKFAAGLGVAMPA